MRPIFSDRVNQRESVPEQRGPTTIGMVQVNNSFSGQCYLPYSAGLIQAHLQANLGDPSLVRFLHPIYSRLPVNEIVDQLFDADLLMFSTYVWNLRLSLLVAEKCKARKPSTRIVFGGPQVPDDATAFLASNPFIDVAVHGEGEQTALRLIESCEDGSWTETSGISYRDPAGRILQNQRSARITDLTGVGSPYLLGVFDEIMDAHPDQEWIALWETNRGCPFSCTFCDWGSATASKVYQFDMERLIKEVDWFSDHRIDFVFCCDANFGIFERDVEIARYVAEKKRKTGYPQALSVQNTKNATDRTYRVQKELGDSGLNKGVTLSMQSLDGTTLERVKRANISITSYQELQRRFTRDRVETYGDLILALPGETYDSFADGVSQLIENGQHNRIQFNNLALLPNAPMSTAESIKEHGLKWVESDIVNIHGSLADVEGEIMERQQLVVATNTMPEEQWVRTRAFCWMTALLHFDKVIQIPIVVTRGCAGFSYREILELFSESELSGFPVLHRVREFFRSYARQMQKGGPEYVRSEKYLNIYWPADELILIQLIANREIDHFYSEALALIQARIGEEFSSLAPVLEDAVRLNRALLKVPFQNNDLTIELRYNLWEYYHGVISGQEIPLQEHPTRFAIDRSSASWWSWDDYCREVIWYGNKKGAYLYGQAAGAPQIAGIY